MAPIMVKAIVLGALSALVCSSGSLAQSSRSEDREVIECSCSPTFFQFTITLDQEPPCTNNDIESNTGIATSETICFKEIGDLTKPEVDGIATASDGELPVLFNDFAVTNITSMYFTEFNSEGDELTSSSVTYDPISLVDGQIISFASASASLDPNLSLQDQINQVPVSVEIKMFGPNPDPNDELCPVISNKLTWTYDMSCGSRPIQTGDNIGWIDMVSTFLLHTSRVLNPNLMCICNQSLVFHHTGRTCQSTVAILSDTTTITGKMNIPLQLRPKTSFHYLTSTFSQLLFNFCFLCFLKYKIQSPTMSMSYGYKFGKGSKNKLIMSKSKSKSKMGKRD